MSFAFPSPSPRSGFTLVEISIVMVIISLIIGGVLVGQDMLRAASLRATMHQIEGYQSAMNNFRARFEGLPGDLATAQNHFAANKWPDAVNGNGNGLIEDDDATVPVNEYSGEVVQFWYQLNAAGMIPERFDLGNTLGTSFPKLEAGRGGIVAGAIDSSTNIWRLCAVSSTAANAMVMENCLTPEEASTIDTKMDDGNPKLGSVTVAGGTDFDDDTSFFDNVWLGTPPSPVSFASLGAGFVSTLLVPSAYAADTETTVLRDACIFKDNDLGTADEQDAGAKYAIASGGVNCQLKISMRY